ncbi:hypothetical protein [Mucilaginibacter terrenus]|uniref:hypothetical protein n=1 Tax=Mucilaginibacter terrenus TaxID=2482727 RepID=UPI001401E482|nr:hypothetical protein [Mucilaginibacter terrenus]
MKKFSLLFFVAALCFLSSCSVVGDIFKAGAYTAIIGIIILVLIIFWIISKFRSNS